MWCSARLTAEPPGEVTVVRDVVYVATSKNPKHRLDVYAPKDARGAPVVHFVHGGYWVEGDKDFYAFVSGLYGSIGGQTHAVASQMALLWLLSLSDGSHSLLDIAERSRLPFNDVHRAARTLEAAGLLRAMDRRQTDAPRGAP